MRHYCMELVGAFFLALAVTFSGNPFAVGLMFMAMYYIGESVSGGYYNPIFAVAAWLRGVLDVREMVLYCFVQVAGAFLAIWWYTAITKNPYMTDVTADMAIWMAILLELLLSAALALVFLTVATSKEYKGSVVNGAVIGLSIAAMLYLGGLYNPAVACGSLLFQMFIGGGATLATDVLGQYLVGPLLGGCAAAFAYDYLHKK